MDKQALDEAKLSIRSLLQKCEKVALSPKLGQSQRTLLERRMAALRIALALINKEANQALEEQRPNQ